MAAHPNILLVMADQLAAPFLPIYGHPVVQAPAVERLAGDGVVFTSAYATSPLCAPARFAMLSGQRNSRIGAYDNASELPAAVPTVAHHLRALGYRTTLCGKMHFVGPDQLHGFERRLTTDIYPSDFGWTPDWDDPEGRFGWWFHNADSVVNAGVAEATNQLDFDDEVGFLAVRELRDAARSADDRPWFLTVSFTHPHDPYVMRQRYWDRYDHDSVDMPRVSAGDVDPDPHSRRLRHVSALDAAELTDAMVRNARHAYYAAISYIDDWLGLLRATLEAFGMADDTVVMFTADHGDQLGERGLWYKMCFFEHAARIPLVVRVPGGARGVAVDDHVSLLDVLPTLVDLAGGDVRSDLGHIVDGASLVPQLHGDRDADRTVLGEYLGEGAIAPVLMIRRGRWKYVWSAPDGPQLFDLASDPDERRNVAHDPERTDVAAAFRAEIDLHWDHERIHREVLASQRARRVVDRALRSGQYVAWDHVPVPDSANQYMRNHLDLNTLELARRLPRPQVASPRPAVAAQAAANGQVAAASWSRTLP
ncbi:MAG TPA: choline-sulfatase [Euzebyales bacterium]|nr:choline-sulfatase [Euzebyales bacterium]